MKTTREDIDKTEIELETVSHEMEQIAHSMREEAKEVEPCKRKLNTEKTYLSELN